MEFTEEIFIRNFIKDSQILGEEDTRYLYEEIFSDILGEEVSLVDLIGGNTLSEASLNEVWMASANPISSPTAGYDFVPKKLGLFSRIKNKLTSMFAGLKGKSFSEILSSGLSWIKNPANMTKVLGTAGGAALVIMLLRALKKKKKMNEYKKLQAIANSSKSALREEFEDEFDWSDPNGSAFAKSKNELIRECQNNRKLKEAVFGKPKVIEESYFDY